MKAMILAGGYGTRISEETSIRPKPMVEIGSMPILWHIMKIYSAHGINDFVICCGYKGHVIKQWFAEYRHRHADLTFDFRQDHTEMHTNGVEPWRVTLVDTGEGTMTGGRIRRAMKYVEDETFCLTYGDGVSNIDIGASIDFHRRHGRKVTMSAVQPEGRWGVFSLAQDEIIIDSFREKPKESSSWINGGFFVVEPGIADYIDGDASTWERDPLQQLAREGEVAAFRHDGFWMAMDSLRDKTVLENLWESNEAPWKIWC